MILNVDPGTEPSGLTLFIESPVFAEPQPQSAAQRKKATQEADVMTLLLERLSARLLGYALARLDSQQFMAAGQPRANDGKWTKGGGGSKIELSGDEQRMVAFYSSGAGSMINDELRSKSGELTMGKKAVPIIDGAIARSTLASDTVFYRGISDDVKLRLTDKAYMSVTDDPRAAPIFGRNVMEIHAPAGSKALDMRSISNHGEGEYLLPRGTKLKQIGPKKTVQGVEVTPYTVESQQQFADPQPLDDDLLDLATVLEGIFEGDDFYALLERFERVALGEFDRISALHGPTTVDPQPIAQLQRDFGSELLTGILRRSAGEVNQIVAAGIESGMSRRDIAEMLSARFPVEIMPDWRARLIAQTEVTRAMNNASRNTYAALGRETLQWLDGQPGACPSCRALHGASVPVKGGVFIDPLRGLQVLHPPLHPACRCSTTAFDESAGEEVDMIPPALAASELQAFMAAGQPRDDHGKWTKGGSIGKFYHRTSAENAASIREHGFEVSNDGNYGAGVYLTNRTDTEIGKMGRSEVLEVEVLAKNPLQVSSLRELDAWWEANGGDERLEVVLKREGYDAILRKFQSGEEWAIVLNKEDVRLSAGEEVDLMQPSLAASELQQFMAAGQPRDADGKWTKGGGSHIKAEPASKDALDRLGEGYILTPPNESQGDWNLRAAVAEQGFDGLPQHGSVEEAIANGGIEIYRGVTDASQVADLRDGEYYAGTGVYGSGIYATTKKSTADSYATGSGAVARMALHRDAKIISEEDVEELSIAKTRELLVNRPPASTPEGFKVRAQQRLYGNKGIAAALEGYDAIKVRITDSEDYYVVLNRTALVME